MTAYKVMRISKRIDGTDTICVEFQKEVYDMASEKTNRYYKTETYTFRNKWFQQGQGTFKAGYYFRNDDGNWEEWRVPNNLIGVGQWTIHSVN